MVGERKAKEQKERKKKGHGKKGKIQGVRALQKSQAQGMYVWKTFIKAKNLRKKPITLRKKS